MPSSVIHEHNYDRQSHRLEITFVSGKMYVYEEVPLAIYLAFTAAFSKGTFFNKFIKDHYRCHEITPAAG